MCATCRRGATSRRLASRGRTTPPVNESFQHLCFAEVVPLWLVELLDLLLEQCGLVGLVAVGEFTDNVLHRDVLEGFA